MMSKNNVIIRPVVSKQFCSTSREVFTVRKRPCAVNGGGFVVYMGSEEIFRVEGCAPHVKDSAILKDAQSTPILSIKRKVGVVQVFSLHKQWKGFVRDEIDGHEKPIFKASSSINCAENNPVKVSLVESDSKSKSRKGWDYEIVGSFSERACAIYDGSGAVAAEVSLNKEIKDATRSRDVYLVAVEAGIDHAFVFGLIAVLEKLNGE